MEKTYPADTCEKCRKTYLACKTCGNSVFDLKQENQTCRCGAGTLDLKTSTICCQRYNHHLGTRCEHCGTMG